MDPSLNVEIADMDTVLHSQLPLNRVKRIARLDPEVHNLALDAVKMISKSTDVFIGLLAKAAYTRAVLEKRRTIQRKDIDYVVKQNELFSFLNGALDNWPEKEPVERKKTSTGNEEEEGEADDQQDNDTEESMNQDIESSPEKLPSTVPLPEQPLEHQS